MEKIINGEFLDPKDIGLKSAHGLSDPRWVNFWDQGDIASAPVSSFYSNDESLIEDKYINTGSAFPATYNAYWTYKEMADYIGYAF